MSGWRWYDRVGGALLLLAALAGGLWASIGSDMFLHPTSLRLDGTTVILVRETPWGETYARWNSEITLIDEQGFECAAQGSAIFQNEVADTVTFTIGPWAGACIDAGPPMVFRARWQVVLFGVIPLRPVSITTLIEGVRE